MSTFADTVVDEKIKYEVKEPGMYKVIFLNDDTTPIEFVVRLLMDLFCHTEKTATDITMSIHHDGSGIAGSYPYEIAEQKSLEATKLSRDNGYPLRSRVEEE